MRNERENYKRRKTNTKLSGNGWGLITDYSRLLIHWQLISMVLTFVLAWFTNLASTRLAQTSWWSAYTGTSHQASPCSDLHTGFDITGEYHDGTSSRTSCSRKISNRTFRAMLCLNAAVKDDDVKVFHSLTTCWTSLMVVENRLV